MTTLAREKRFPACRLGFFEAIRLYLVISLPEASTWREPRRVGHEARRAEQTFLQKHLVE